MSDNELVELIESKINTYLYKAYYNGAAGLSGNINTDSKYLTGYVIGFLGVNADILAAKESNNLKSKEK